ncbi:MAG: DEAD/DEAH box helicase, partial [Fimbriimonas ginsengisoli]|nr:DEAD/DEAH box helicase [Fimbriimonas ginsengisoli]
MEGTFPWVETPAQHQAILDVKGDLGSNTPMDRLVCGDVGFGKTEVAIRAAFKVVQAGRQVAVLCPTTILSEQHFRTFSERLDPFSVRLALINRFQKAFSRNRTTRELGAGAVDVLIGTHALLGKEVKFKDLGLVVIDEEQKFGVKQKELLKHLRSEVDVLTLSATPIPRTLSMALMDIRQMSLINDPPPGRLPIRTFLRTYSAEVVREAILRELARGGQVFYVFNRVSGITHVAERLRLLVPTARIGVGHGQMTEGELEPVMMGFLEGEIDVLLSTTIIENGLDISNANTLIVENADQLGLAQLYQLRGRVGRSDRQAYAYLLYHPSK